MFQHDYEELPIMYIFCFGLENYLNLLICKRSRRCLTRLRISAHNHRIESGRYGNNRLQRQDRLCQLCDTRAIDEEFHFVLKCKAYRKTIQMYIKCYYYKKPNMYKLTELLQSNKTHVLINLCKYISTAHCKETNFCRHDLKYLQFKTYVFNVYSFSIFN